MKQKATETIAIKVTPQTKRLVSALAGMSCVTQSNYVRQLIAANIIHHKIAGTLPKVATDDD